MQNLSNSERATPSRILAIGQAVLTQCKHCRHRFMEGAQGTGTPGRTACFPAEPAESRSTGSRRLNLAAVQCCPALVLGSFYSFPWWVYSRVGRYDINCFIFEKLSKICRRPGGQRWAVYSPLGRPSRLSAAGVRHGFMEGCRELTMISSRPRKT